MRLALSKFLRSIPLAVVGTVLLASSLMVGVTSITAPAPVKADACPQDDAPETNLLYCGMPSSSASAALSTFESYYNNNNDNHGHADIQAIYNADCFSGTCFSSAMFNTGSWQIGTAIDKYTSPVANHTVITLNGTVVGTDLRIAARCPSMEVNCSPSSQYPYYGVSNVHLRDGNWFFAKDGNGVHIHTMTTLIHFNAAGVADFAEWTECGNLLQFTPVVPPTPVLFCKQLDLAQTAADDNTISYSFVVTSHSEFTPNFTFNINFGDNSAPASMAASGIGNGDTTATFTHVYTRLAVDTTYTISANVNGQAQVAACQKQIQIPAKLKLTFACLELDHKLIRHSSGSRTYSFTASTQGSDTAQTYQFVFGDKHLTAFQTSNTFTHTYSFSSSTVHSFTAYFVATSKTGLTTDKNDHNCQFMFTTQLVRTGPEGTFGLIAATSALGFGFHQFLLRRKLGA